MHSTAPSLLPSFTEIYCLNCASNVYVLQSCVCVHVCARARVCVRARLFLFFEFETMMGAPPPLPGAPLPRSIASVSSRRCSLLHYSINACWLLLHASRMYGHVVLISNIIIQADRPAAHCPLQVTQEAGDLLFVPREWGHAVLNVQPSVGVAIEFDSVWSRSGDMQQQQQQQ